MSSGTYRPPWIQKRAAEARSNNNNTSNSSNVYNPASDRHDREQAVLNEELLKLGKPWTQASDHVYLSSISFVDTVHRWYSAAWTPTPERDLVFRDDYRIDSGVRVISLQCRYKDTLGVRCQLFFAAREIRGKEGKYEQGDLISRHSSNCPCRIPRQSTTSSALSPAVSAKERTSSSSASSAATFTLLPTSTLSPSNIAAVRSAITRVKRKTSHHLAAPSSTSVHSSTTSGGSPRIHASHDSELPNTSLEEGEVFDGGSSLKAAVDKAKSSATIPASLPARPASLPARPVSSNTASILAGLALSPKRVKDARRSPLPAATPSASTSSTVVATVTTATDTPRVTSAPISTLTKGTTSSSTAAALQTASSSSTSTSNTPITSTPTVSVATTTTTTASIAPKKSFTVISPATDTITLEHERELSAGEAERIAQSAVERSQIGHIAIALPPIKRVPSRETLTKSSKSSKSSNNFNSNNNSNPLKFDKKVVGETNKVAIVNPWSASSTPTNSPTMPPPPLPAPPRLTSTTTISQPPPPAPTTARLPTMNGSQNSPPPQSSMKAIPTGPRASVGASPRTGWTKLRPEERNAVPHSPFSSAISTTSSISVGGASSSFTIGPATPRIAASSSSTTGTSISVNASSLNNRPPPQRQDGDTPPGRIAPGKYGIAAAKIRELAGNMWTGRGISGERRDEMDTRAWRLGRAATAPLPPPPPPCAPFERKTSLPAPSDRARRLPLPAPEFNGRRSEVPQSTETKQRSASVSLASQIGAEFPKQQNHVTQPNGASSPDKPQQRAAPDSRDMQIDDSTTKEHKSGSQANTGAPSPDKPQHRGVPASLPPRVHATTTTRGQNATVQSERNSSPYKVQSPSMQLQAEQPWTAPLKWRELSAGAASKTATAAPSASTSSTSMIQTGSSDGPPRSVPSDPRRNAAAFKKSTTPAVVSNVDIDKLLAAQTASAAPTATSNAAGWKPSSSVGAPAAGTDKSAAAAPPPPLTPATEHTLAAQPKTTPASTDKAASNPVHVATCPPVAKPKSTPITSNKSASPAPSHTTSMPSAAVPQLKTAPAVITDVSTDKPAIADATAPAVQSRASPTVAARAPVDKPAATVAAALDHHAAVTATNAEAPVVTKDTSLQQPYTPALVKPNMSSNSHLFIKPSLATSSRKPANLSVETKRSVAAKSAVRTSMGLDSHDLLASFIKSAPTSAVSGGFATPNTTSTSIFSPALPSALDSAMTAASTVARCHSARASSTSSEGMHSPGGSSHTSLPEEGDHTLNSKTKVTGKLPGVLRRKSPTRIDTGFRGFTSTIPNVAEEEEEDIKPFIAGINRSPAPEMDSDAGPASHWGEPSPPAPSTAKESDFWKTDIPTSKNRKPSSTQQSTSSTTTLQATGISITSITSSSSLFGNNGLGRTASAIELEAIIVDKVARASPELAMEPCKVQSQGPKPDNKRKGVTTGELSRSATPTVKESEKSEANHSHGPATPAEQDMESRKKPRLDNQTDTAVVKSSISSAKKKSIAIKKLMDIDEDSSDSEPEVPIAQLAALKSNTASPEIPSTETMVESDNQNIGSKRKKQDAESKENPQEPKRRKVTNNSVDETVMKALAHEEAKRAEQEREEREKEEKRKAKLARRAERKRREEEEAERLEKAAKKKAERKKAEKAAKEKERLEEERILAEKKAEKEAKKALKEEKRKKKEEKRRREAEKAQKLDGHPLGAQNDKAVTQAGSSGVDTGNNSRQLSDSSTKEKDTDKGPIAVTESSTGTPLATLAAPLQSNVAGAVAVAAASTIHQDSASDTDVLLSKYLKSCRITQTLDKLGYRTLNDLNRAGVKPTRESHHDLLDMMAQLDLSTIDAGLRNDPIRSWAAKRLFHALLPSARQ